MTTEAKKIIKAEGLSLTRNDEVILDSINWKLPAGQKCCILGENGAGKSTLLDCLTKFEREYNGKIYLKGSNLENYKLKELFDIIQVSYQESSLESPINVEQYLELCRLSDSAKDQVLEFFDLKNKLYIPLNALSGGEKRKLVIGFSLFSDKDILFFDEPTGFLDQKSKLAFQEKVKTLKGKTILIITHDLQFGLDTCDHFLGLKNGRLIFSGDRKVITDDSIKLLYDLPENSPSII